MQRVLEAEQMDEPTLPLQAHYAALDGLRRINRASGVVEQLLTPLLAFAGKQGLKAVNLLDVAAGGGDVPVALVTAARAAGVEVRLTMFDRSEAALAKAKTIADHAGVDAELICGDVLDHDLAATADVVTCSLFLHHLTEEQAISVLRRLRSATNGLLLISDLRRCVGGIAAAHIACRMLTRSPVVHFDGPVSARAAWTVAELRAMARSAKMPEARIRPVWPFRQLMEWEKPTAESTSAEHPSV